MQNISSGINAFEPALSPGPADAAVAGSILIAMDDTPHSVSASRAGVAIARHWELTPRILTIIEPSVVAPGVAAPAVLTYASPPDADRVQRVRAIRTQLREMTGEGRDWPIEVEVGNPSDAIAWTAMRDTVGLVIMGLRAHGRWDRIAGRETVLQVVRQVNTPVLAATPQLEGLPRRALVAMDFSRSSVRALRLVLRLAAPGATIDMAYVRPRADFESEVAEGAGVIMQQGISASFARLQRILDVPSGVMLRPMLLNGKPGDALLQAAAEQGADLIVAGRHRRDFLDRLTIGSVATQLIRAAQCSVLITPAGPDPSSR